jgi:fumarate reductase flavoprotein subunit
LTKENQKQHLIGIGVMVVATAVLIGISQPVYEAISKRGRVQGTESIYTPGTYEAEEQGFGGTVKAVVTVDDKNITALELTGPDETPALGGNALTSLQAEILQKQTAEVDSVSGASITSGAIKTAVSEALSAARGE